MFAHIAYSGKRSDWQEKNQLKIEYGQEILTTEDDFHRMFFCNSPLSMIGWMFLVMYMQNYMK